ncbi:MAG: SCO family protein, partial [Rhodospirillales bacterium]|nr:SCO family protein [Rhodospirillales bacterium]
TVDPERDDTEGIGDYAAAFHPRLIGLTGSTDQVKEAARAYRVFYAKVQEDETDPEDYLVDHSAYTYFMDRDGKYLTHFPHGADPLEMARRIEEHL